MILLVLIINIFLFILLRKTFNKTLTIVNIRDLLLEVDDGGHVVKSESLGRFLVVDLHKLDSVPVTIVVYFFELS